MGAAFAIYYPALQGAFVYDDFHHITRAELRSWDGLKLIWTDPTQTAQYYPVSHSVFWLQHKLWSDNVLGYHFVNVFLHGSVAFLLGRFLQQVGVRGARWAALVFLCHPMCVESAAWVSEQKNTLSALFFLGAALFYFKFHEQRRIVFYVAATLFFVLALLAKSVTSVLPAALLVLLWWKYGRVDLKRDVAPLAPWLLLGLASGLFTVWLEKTFIGASGPGFEMSLAERVLVAGRAAWFYAGKGIWPADLCFNYPRWIVDSGAIWQYAFPAAAIAVVVACVAFARKWRGPATTVLLFLGALFPALGFFNIYPFRFSYVADHFAYLGLMPLIAGITGLVVTVSEAGKDYINRGLSVTAAAVVMIFGYSAHQYSHVFATEEGFYREILTRNPQSALARYNLGTLLKRQPGGREKAVAEFRAAIAIDPKYAEAYNNLGMLLRDHPESQADAKDAFATALNLMPDLVEANYNMAVLLLHDEASRGEALRLLSNAVRLRPKFAEAHFQLGHLYELEGNHQVAKAAYERAIHLKPSFAAAYYALGVLMAEDPSTLAQAEPLLAEAVRLNPVHAEAHYSLGAVRGRLPGKQVAAIESYRQALRLDPDFAEAHNNLGRLLVQTPGGLAEALAHFEAALRINPSSVEARRNYELARKALLQKK